MLAKEIDIYYPAGGAVAALRVRADGGSRLYEGLMEPAWVELRFARAEWVEVPVGAWVELEGRRYTLYAPAAVQREGAQRYEYTARFESAARELEAIMLLNPVDGRSAFTLTATPREHAQQVVDNMNARGGGGWSLAGCIEGGAREVGYDHADCLSALGQVCEAFETEWRCEGRALTVGPVGRGADDPLPLAYGPAGGLKPGLRRAVHGEDGNPIGRLFVQGGTRNIDLAAYGAKRLLLPRGAVVRFDGLRFEGEAGFAASRAVAYAASADGASVARAAALAGVPYREAALDLSEVYPAREGEVTGVVTRGGTGSGAVGAVVDWTIPDDLDYNDCRIPGEKATLIFQSGQLAGREFDLEQTETALTGYEHARRMFRLVAQEEGGVTLPGAAGGAFAPRAGDRYAVFNVRLPARYVAEAERALLREAVRYLHPRAGHRFTVRAEVDGQWARARWENVGGALGLGAYVSIADAELFGASGQGAAVLRVVGVSRAVGALASPTLELSNEPAAGGVYAALRRARAQEQIVAARHGEAIAYTRRGLRAAREGLRQLADAAAGMEEKFSESVRPATVHTLGVLAGSEATNFTLAPRAEITWHGEGRWVGARGVGTADGALELRHATAGTDPQRAGVLSGQGAQGRAWLLAAWRSGSLADAGTPYYLYAACREAPGDTYGHFLLSESPRALRDGGWWYFLVALVSSADARGGAQRAAGVRGDGGGPGDGAHEPGREQRRENVLQHRGGGNRGAHTLHDAGGGGE